MSDEVELEPPVPLVVSRGDVLVDDWDAPVRSLS